MVSRKYTEMDTGSGAQAKHRETINTSHLLDKARAATGGNWLDQYQRLLKAKDYAGALAMLRMPAPPLTALEAKANV